MEFHDLGKHCSKPDCNILDFLPFTCNLCKKIYCVDHHKYDEHSCPEAHKRDVRIPICPLCDKPVPNKPGQTPDIAVNQHLENGCRSKQKMGQQNTYKCSEKHCKAKEIITVKCDICGSNYCLRHRHAADHNCVGPVIARRNRTLNGSIFKNWLKPTHQETKAAPPKQTIQRGVQVSHSGDVNHLSKLQGNMTEEQAMQAALSASRGDGHPTPPEDDDLSAAIARSLVDLETKPTRSIAKSLDCVLS